VIGRYFGPEEEAGISLSFASGVGIIGVKTWSDLFEDPNDGRQDYTEAQILLALDGPYTEDETELFVSLTEFFDEYYDVIGAVYGNDSVLVNFSTGTFGGIVTVPEPSSLLGFACGLLALLLVGRRPRVP
jgi:hypothetical protein